jgi:integrase/recombinase XerD
MEALIDYLINGRPDTNTQQLFVYHRAPSGKPIKPSTVRRAFLSAGFSAAKSQVHRLRHTMATCLRTIRQ